MHELRQADALHRVWRTMGGVYAGLICGPTTQPVERGLQMGSGAPSLRHFHSEVPGRFSHFLERVHFNLPDTFARYVEFFGQVFE